MPDGVSPVLPSYGCDGYLAEGLEEVPGSNRPLAFRGFNTLAASYPRSGGVWADGRGETGCGC